MSMFHEGHRELQDRYEGRAVPDQIAKHRLHQCFTPEDKQLIESAAFFFLASAWQETVDCSMKGGDPGFVYVSAKNEITWPDYDGNRMYRSLGNLYKNPNVGLLFLKFDGSTTRLRISGQAIIDEQSPDIQKIPGAKRLIRVTATEIFYNCPRYIPEMTLVKHSIYSPRHGQTPPDPEWKNREYIKDIL